LENGLNDVVPELVEHDIFENATVALEIGKKVLLTLNRSVPNRTFYHI
jgi:hypothetical protein